MICIVERGERSFVAAGYLPDCRFVDRHFFGECRNRQNKGRKKLREMQFSADKFCRSGGSDPLSRLSARWFSLRKAPAGSGHGKEKTSRMSREVFHTQTNIDDTNDANGSAEISVIVPGCKGGGIVPAAQSPLLRILPCAAFIGKRSGRRFRPERKSEAGCCGPVFRLPTRRVSCRRSGAPVLPRRGGGFHP